MRAIPTLAVLFALQAAAACASAHDAHEHGVARVDVGIGAQGLELALSVDGHGAVGFERRPSSAEEIAMVASAEARLGAVDTLLAAPPSAQCRVGSAVVHSPYASAGGSSRHVDWRAEYVLVCARAGALEWLDFSGFFAAFPGVEEIELQLVSDRGQSGAELTPASPRWSQTTP